jgi:hypothetical protein
VLERKLLSIASTFRDGRKMVLGVIGRGKYHKSLVLFISAYNGSCISHGENWVWSGVYIKRESVANGTFMDLSEIAA